MLDAVNPVEGRGLQVDQRRIPVTIGGSRFAALTIEYPSVEDLVRLRTVPPAYISIKRAAEDPDSPYRQAFFDAAKAAEERAARFEGSANFHARLADLYAMAGATDLAAQLNEKALSLDAGAPFRLRVGADLVHRGRYDEADQLFRKTEDVDPCELLSRRAAVSLMQQKTDEAAELLKQALVVDPTNEVVRYLSGVTHLIRSEFEFAIADFRAAIGAFRHSSSLQVNIAVCYVCLGRNEKALDALKQAVLLNPIDQVAVSVYADLSFFLEKAGQATPALTTYLRYEQRSPEMWARSARAHYVQGNYADAYASLKHQLALQESSSVYNNLGVVVHKLGKTALAGQHYARAVQLSQGEADNTHWAAPMMNLVRWRLGQGELKEALRLSKAIVKFDSDEQLLRDESYTELYALHLHCLVRLELFDDFEREASRIAQNSHASVGARCTAICDLLYAQSLLKADHEAARELVDLGLELLPRLPQTEGRLRMTLLNNIAVSILEANRPEDSDLIAEVLSVLSQHFHKLAAPTATLGLYHFRRGHIDKGEELYREAARLTPDKKLQDRIKQKLRLELARNFLQLGDHRAAEKQFTKALEIKSDIPSFEVFARQGMESLRRLKAPSRDDN